MKVKELIEELSKYDGELDVRVNADHGQCMMRVNHVELCAYDDDEYMLEDYVTKDFDVDF